MTTQKSDDRGFLLSKSGHPIEAVCGACGCPMITTDGEGFMHDCDCMHRSPAQQDRVGTNRIKAYADSSEFTTSSVTIYTDIRRMAEELLERRSRDEHGAEPK
jgi:hypothetical protein